MPIDEILTNIGTRCKWDGGGLPTAAGTRHNFGVTAPTRRDDSLVTFDFPVPEARLNDIYVHLIRTPSATRESLVEAGHDPGEVTLALQILADRGLVEVHADGALVVAPPEPALSAYSADVERRLRRVRASAPQLARLYRRARDQEEARHNPLRASGLCSVAEIRAANLSLIADAQESVLAMRAYGEPAIQLLTSPESDHENLGHRAGADELQHLAVYDTRLLEIAGVLEVLRRRQAAGEQVRLVRDLPLSVTVVDGTSGIIDLTNIDPSGAGSASVWHSPLIAGMTALVEGFHRRGAPLPEEDRGGSTPVAERDRMIINLLGAGASDAMVARQLGVSVRTVERRVRTLMDQLEAGSRMQLGIEAVRRGLIPTN